MTFFQFAAPQPGQKYDYPTLGFFAADGAILDGTASNPAITTAPDAHWTAVASGAESGITRYRQPQTPPDDQSSWDGSLLVYDATTRAFVRKAPSDAIASTTGLGQALNAAYASKARGLINASPFYPTAPLAQAIYGVDTIDGRLYSINGTSFFESRDGGNTWSTNKGGPPNFGPTNGNALPFVRWGGYLYTIQKDTGDGNVKLWRAAPTANLNDPFTWSASLLTLTAGSVRGFATQIAGSSWGTNDALIVADYGPDPTGGPSMWRSTDGATWTKVLGPIAGTRHIHAVFPDSYRQGQWWMTCGDGTGYEYFRSTDYGQTWTQVTTSADGQDLTLGSWQSVQISADADALYFCGDSGYFTVFKMLRKDLDKGIIRPIISPSYHQQLTLPNGMPGRGPFTDGAITAGSKTLTSATANFTASDVGRFVAWGGTAINPGSYTDPMRPFIVSVQSATSCTLSMQAASSASALTFTLGPDVLYAGAFFGAVDPATGIVYQLANDGTSAGTRCGLFATLPDGRCVLLESWGPTYSCQVFIYNGNVYCGRMRRPLLTLGQWGT